jgi:hypothetical protein
MKQIVSYHSFNEQVNIQSLKVGQKVKYKKQDNTEEEKPIDRIDLDNKKIIFKNKEGKEFSKSINDIILDQQPQTIDKKEDENVEDKIKTELTNIKNDKGKLNKVLNFINFVEKEK